MVSFYVEPNENKSPAAREPMSVEQAHRIIQTELAKDVGSAVVSTAQKVPARAVLWGESKRTPANQMQVEVEPTDSQERA